MKIGQIGIGMFSLCAGLSLQAEESRAQGQSLAQAADDPTASLMALQVSDWYTSSYHGLSGEDANTVVIRPAIPYMLGNSKHIFRATVPFITDSPFTDTGLSDMTLFDLTVFSESWGRWSVGAVSLLPTGGSSRGAENWALGPAMGFTVRHDQWLLGLFNQNLFSVARGGGRSAVNVSVVQPIINYRLGNGWSCGGSEMTFTYDWQESQWRSLPLGCKVAKLVRMGKIPVQLSLQYEHDFADDEVGPEDTFRFTAKFLFPK